MRNSNLFEVEFPKTNIPYHQSTRIAQTFGTEPSIQYKNEHTRLQAPVILELHCPRFQCLLFIFLFLANLSPSFFLKTQQKKKDLVGRVDEDRNRQLEQKNYKLVMLLTKRGGIILGRG